MDYKEKIYQIMNGQLTEIESLQIGDFLVEDEFADGKECNELYEEVYEANRRLCSRLKTEEDRDVELIINNMFKIARNLAMKMYDCGVASGKLGCIDTKDKWKNE